MRSRRVPSLFMPALACLPPACLGLSRPVPSRLQAASCLLYMKSVFVTGSALCLFPTSCVYSDLQDCSCLRRAGSGPLPACLGLLLPPPHEVGVCRRFCPVSFPDFVCLFGFARLLVSVPSRLQAASYLPPPARLLHMKSVFVAGYALCHFPTSCVFPRPWLHPSTGAHAVRGPVSRPPLYPANGLDVTACRTRSPKLRCLPVPSGAVACSTGS